MDDQILASNYTRVRNSLKLQPEDRVLGYRALELRKLITDRLRRNQSVHEWLKKAKSPVHRAKSRDK